MSTTIQQIITVVLVLATLLAIYSTAVFIVFWIFKQLFKWLYKKAWFLQAVLWIQKELRNLIRKIEPIFVALWEFYSEILADLSFYGYAAVAVYDRLQSISEYIRQNPEHNYFQILDSDMNADPYFYFVFLVIFNLWLISKAWKHSHDERKHKAIEKNLENISEVLQDMNKKLNTTGIVRKASVHRRVKK